MLSISTSPKILSFGKDLIVIRGITKDTPTQKAQWIQQGMSLGPPGHESYALPHGHVGLILQVYNYVLWNVKITG